MIRTITTAAELDALPVGSVVLDRWGRAWQKHDPEGRDPLWHAAKHHTRRYNTAALIERGPLLVLHDPSVVPEAAVTERGETWIIDDAAFEEAARSEHHAEGLLDHLDLTEYIDLTDPEGDPT